MTVRELIQALLSLDMDYEVKVYDPNQVDEMFVDSVSFNNTQKEVYIKTQYD